MRTLWRDFACGIKVDTVDVHQAVNMLEEVDGQGNVDVGAQDRRCSFLLGMLADQGAGDQR
jgi:hypothetical protein